MSDEQTSEEFEVTEGPRRRRDYQSAAPRRKPGRKPKRRHDSELEAAMDGWGNPFDIKLARGWVAFWVSAEDEHALSFRRWEIGTYGDPRILEYRGILPGAKGQPIKTKETTLYLMRAEEATRMREADPARRKQQVLRKQLFRKASESRLPTGERGRARFHEVTI